MIPEEHIDAIRGALAYTHLMTIFRSSDFVNDHRHEIEAAMKWMEEEMSKTNDDRDEVTVWLSPSDPPRLLTTLTFGEWMRDYAPKLLVGQKLNIKLNGQDLGPYRIVSAQLGQMIVEKVEEDK